MTDNHIYRTARRQAARLLTGLLLLLAPATLWADPAQIVTSGGGSQCTWTMQNDRLSLTLDFVEGKGLTLTQLTNRTANCDLTGAQSLLFSYRGRLLSLSPDAATTSFVYAATDADWQLADSQVEDIRMSSVDTTHIGLQLSIILRRAEMQVRATFQIYDDNAGLRYQTFLQNLTTTHRMVIENGEVIRLDFPNQAHWLHYVDNTQWLSTRGTLEETTTGNKGRGVPRCLICLYDKGYGWYLAPETNWKTQYGPEVSGDRSSPSYDYMLRPFAATAAWPSTGRRYVSVKTCPEAFQLVLRPAEEFEYIAVNLTAFSGDIVDGKMAVEEHLYRRFHYHHTTTSFMINDWDWFTNGKRTESYFTNTVFPLARKAGYDILLIDDGWNNSSADGRGLNNSGLSRDPIVSNTPGIPDMKRFAQRTAAAGLRLGLWYSISGGYHNTGHDLADPAALEVKEKQIETMIQQYGLTHQAVDLTEYWQNAQETSYSSPSDNVYRKAVLTRNMMNRIVDRHPDYEFKVTSEMDIFPTQGDRSTELLHVVNNGWLTITGGNTHIDALGIHFGHLPLGAVYTGGKPTVNMAELYAMLSARNIKTSKFPSDWDGQGVQRMGQLNSWRKSARVKQLTDNVIRPIYWGMGFDNPDASQWQANKGPYVWMYRSEQKDLALVLATYAGRNLEPSAPDRFPLRWLNAQSKYAVEDVTLDDTGIFTYAYVGTFSGEELNRQGLPIDFTQNSSPAKAFWIKEIGEEPKQVIFADEHVKSYTATSTAEGSLLIRAEGEPKASGVAIVYDAQQEQTMQVSLNFDDEGKTELLIDEVQNNDVPYPGLNISLLRFDPEQYHDNVLKSNSAIRVESYYNGSPDSEGGYSSVATMTAEGDYVTYQFPMPVSGRYSFRLNYKLSKSSRGTAQFSIVDEAGNEELLGAAIDESTNDSERMVTKDLGTNDVAAGTLRVRMKLVGGGLSKTGKLIGFNYLELIK